MVFCLQDTNNSFASPIKTRYRPHNGLESCIVRPCPCPGPPTIYPPGDCGRLLKEPLEDKCWRKYANNETKMKDCPENSRPRSWGSYGYHSYVGGLCVCEDDYVDNGRVGGEIGSNAGGFYCRKGCLSNGGALACGAKVCSRDEKDNQYCGCIAGFNLTNSGQCRPVENVCEVCKHDCHMSQKCIPTGGEGEHFTCSECSHEMGFESNKAGSCSNINECTAGTHQCDLNAVCIDADPSKDGFFGVKYNCTCRTGWTGEGTKCNPCVDINECVVSPGICGLNSECTNTPGSYTCKCKEGFQPGPTATNQHNKDCIDINECLNPYACLPNSLCNNTVPGYECPCIPGYIGEGKHRGCLPDDSVCGSCVNTTTKCALNQAGNKYFCDCLTNHTRVDEFNCKPNTYCDKPNSVDCAPHPKGNCSDKPDGSGYTCTCNSGYRDVGNGDGKKCEEIDICKRKSPCQYVHNTVCQSLEPDISEFYDCICKDKHVRQNEGIGNRSAPCFEEDIFMANNCSACDRLTEDCVHPINMNGVENVKLKSCTCRKGFERKIDDKCHNINECVRPELNDCDPVRAVCRDVIPTNENSNTTHTCECIKGYTGTGKVNNCSDINECTLKDDNGNNKHCIKEGEVCKNLVPGFECECITGYHMQYGVCVDRNECVEYSHSCNAHSVCNNTIGSYNCECAKGFRQNGTHNGQPTCESINQCVEGILGTGKQACVPETENCIPLLGSYECVCKKGYKRIHNQCIDDDECREKQTHQCDMSTTVCTNTPGSYDCECLEGYERDTKYTCKDINECATGNFSCHGNSYCKNLHGSYRCICNEGYEPARNSLEKKPYCDRIKICPKNPFICNSGTCIDLSEEPFFRCECPEGTVAFNNTMCIDSRYCDETDAWPCPEHSKCQKRCQCDVGYDWKIIDQPLTLEKIKKRECKEIDWCATAGKKQCKHTKCRPTPERGPGTGECFCDAGFEMVDKRCHDINECLVNATICPQNAFCDNTPGSYACICNDGYTKAQGSTPTNPICENYNECDFNKDNCTLYKNTVCKDTVGAFTCDCLPGYIRDQIGDDKIGEGRYALRGCVDDNECERDPCDENADCENCAGSYSCICPVGYHGAGTKDDPCVDRDECALNIHNCTLLENCVNTDGDFKCECKTGYQRIRGQCVDIDECIENTFHCEGNKKCNNTIGSYFCSCPKGYFLNPKTDKCEDINECSFPGQCPQGKGDICVNTEGSYKCECIKGYAKSCKGNNCKQECLNIDECQVKNETWGCGPGTNCTDTQGDYSCICKNFHVGDPYNKKEGCKYIEICTREPCKGPNEVCIPTNEKIRRCECATGYVRELDTCKENPCKHTKCGGGHCFPQIYDNKLIGNCLCPSDMIYDKEKDECIPSDVCECGVGVKNCTNSPKCTDPDYMYCFSRGAKADCKCFDYMKYNSETKKCEEINFCEPNPCPGHPFNATCENVKDKDSGLNREFKCKCPPGYKWWKDTHVVFAPGACLVDKDCEEEKGCMYKPNTHCDKVGHVCVCNTGYHPDNKTDECIKQDPCVLRAQTTGKPACPENSYEDSRDDTCQCNCMEGYNKDCSGGVEKCVNRNECVEGVVGAENIDPCLHNKTHPECADTDGGWVCTCGNKRQDHHNDPITGECVLIDRCKHFEPVVCSNFSSCESTSGDCKCDDGFTKPCKECGCENVDECKTGDYLCMPHSDCKDLTPSYTCVCSAGYEPKPGVWGRFNFTCENKNECLKNPCPVGSKCHDTEGSYRCECLPPLLQHGSHNCAVNKTEGCDPGCVKHAHCIKLVNENTVFNCTCDYGYDGDGHVECKPRDFCGLDKPCGPFSTCGNGQGDYSCTCLPGYTGNGKDKIEGCKKIDYCKGQLNPCPKDSSCYLLDKAEEDYRISDSKAWTNCTCLKGFDFNRRTFTCVDVNECNKNPCPKEATKCINTQGSFTCECPKGFVYDAKLGKCIDINECQTSESASCTETTGTCVNEIGSWRCECLPAYRNKKDKFSCELHKECGTETDKCDRNSTTCEETFPGTFCKCREGYQKHDSVSTACFDIPECAFGKDNCSPITEDCINYSGGFTCKCKAEYERDENNVCQPLVRCTDKCPEYSVCVVLRNNTSTCRCHNGYELLKEYNTCSIKSCDQSHCGPHSTCQVNQIKNTTGEVLHFCACDEGYKMRGSDGMCYSNRSPRSDDACNGVNCGIGQCYTMKEAPYYKCVCPGGNCAITTCKDKVCDSNAICVDPPVPAGSQPQEAYCQCQEGWDGLGTARMPCYKIDACRDYLCSNYAFCKKENGQSKCVCDPHYHGNGTFCADVDECAAEPNGEIKHNCDADAECINVQGGFTCHCKLGFRGVGTKGDCEDIDECLPSEGANMLCDDVSTTCNNTKGSYKCDCKPGFKNTSSEYKCEDIDECVLDTDKKLCGIHTCINTIPSYECKCNDGYTQSLDKKQCNDINECETKSADCHPKADCTNLPGSFNCTCKDGYSGDGRSKCELIDLCADDTLNKCKKDSTTCRMLSDRPVYKCDCKPGFVPAAGQSDYHSCDDIDECIDVRTNYDRETTICINKPGTYELKCKPGYENTHPNKTGNATHNVLCTNLNECAQDPAFGETVARIESGQYKVMEWEKTMVPPKDNSSAYAYCYWLAKHGMRFSNKDVTLPMCRDTPPTKKMSLFLPHKNPPVNFVQPQGFSCACPAGDLPTAALGKEEIPKCSEVKCNCDKDMLCKAGKCVCSDPNKKMLKNIDGKYRCDNNECGNGITLPPAFDNKQERYECVDGKFKAKNGYELVRDDYGAAIDVIDIDECAMEINPCCESKTCEGPDCVKCLNTVGSFACVLQNSTTKRCLSVDKNTCKCGNVDCGLTQSWFFSCINGCNATMDPRLDLPEYKRPLCSRVVNIDGNYKTFNNLRELYHYTCSIDESDDRVWLHSNKYACYFNKDGNDLSASPLFNYWGPCTSIKEDVKCKVGTPQSPRENKNIFYCGKHYTKPDPSPAIGQVYGQDYNYPRECNLESKESYENGSFGVEEETATMMNM